MFFWNIIWQFNKSVKINFRYHHVFNQIDVWQAYDLIISEISKLSCSEIKNMKTYFSWRFQNKRIDHIGPMYRSEWLHFHTILTNSTFLFSRSCSSFHYAQAMSLNHGDNLLILLGKMKEYNYHNQWKNWKKEVNAKFYLLYYSLVMWSISMN